MTMKKHLMAPLAGLVCTIALSGCPSPPGSTGGSGKGASADGTRCGSEVASGPVYIDVTYHPDGTPVDPGDCAVVSGTDVTWRGPDKEPVQFEIRFKAAAPLAPGERNLLSSAEIDGRYKVMRKISGEKGRYDYAIKANGRELDPAIIIR